MTLPVYKPSDWNSALKGYYSIEVDSTLFGYQGASKSYSISAPDQDTVRFELHDGDMSPWDAMVNHSAERDELASRATLAYNGTPLEISYGFTLEPGAANSANWIVLGQLHQNIEDTTATGGPVFEVSLAGENMQIIARYNDASGKLVQMTLWSDPLPIVRGHEYQMDIKVVTDPSGQNGRLIVSRDGVTVADYSGALGDKNMTGVYWAEGIYRDGNASETMAADYSNLKISTGNAVHFPDRSEFVAAPVLTVREIDASATSGGGSSDTGIKVAASAPAGGFQVKLSGNTVAGGKIDVYENGSIVASGIADQAGHLTMDLVANGTGTHQYFAVATDVAGHQSPMARPVDVIIGTAKDIGGRLDALAADKNLGGIFVTDSQVLDVGTSTDLSRILHYTTLLHDLNGVQYLRATNVLTGKSYDKEIIIDNLSGNAVEQQRYSGGRLIFDQVISADKSSVVRMSNGSGGFDVRSIAADGFLTGYNSYDSQGRLYSAQTFGRDGFSSTTKYDLETGKLISLFQKNSDKSTIAITLNITGQDYSVQSFTYNSAGMLVLQERFTPNGVKTLSSVSNADGSRSITTYDAKTGRETKSTVYMPDGSSVQELFGIAGRGYSEQTTYFDKTGKVTKITTSNDVGEAAPTSNFIAGLLQTTSPTKLPSINSVDGSWFDASGQRMASAPTADPITLLNADGSTTVTTFQAGSSTIPAMAITYSASGAKLEAVTYDNGGAKISDEIFAADGTDTLTLFDAATNMRIGVTQTKADGSKMITDYQPGSSSLPAIVSNFNAAGTLIEKEVYDATGLRADMISFNAQGQRVGRIQSFGDGSRVSTIYSSADGSVLQSSTVFRDGSRIDVNNAIVGRPYASQTVQYNAVGKVVSMSRYYGDAAHTLAMTQVANADGSSELHSYDTAGREISRTVTSADGTSEVVNSIYSGTSTTPSTVQDFHYAAGGKLLWSDVTNPNGSHNIAVATSGVSVSSNPGVSDTFLSASTGASTFVFQPAFGQDLVTNFHAGAGTNHDTLDLTAFHLSQNSGDSGAGVLAQMLRQSGNDVILTVSPTDTVMLKNTVLANLATENFRI